jgi:hypothetical protein
MLWTLVSAVIRMTILGWLGLFALTIMYQIMAGRIYLGNVISHDREQSFGFHRLQLIGVTLLFAAGYIVTALGQPADQGMPDISTPLLAALLGSHVAYLGGKLLQ